jgi:hypothetical protein
MVLVSAKKVKKKISCLCTFNIADIPSHQLTAGSAWNPLEKDGDFCRPN